MIDLHEFADWPADLAYNEVSSWGNERLLAVAEACQREAEHANPLELVMLRTIFNPVMRALDLRKDQAIERGIDDLLGAG